jgi:hypothetical protein
MPVPADAAQGRLAEQVNKMIRSLRCLHYSYRTEEAYVDWARRFLSFAQAERVEELGCRQGARVPGEAGCGRQGVGIDPEPGPERARVFLPRRAGQGVGPVGRVHSGQAAPEDSGGADAQRGGAALPVPEWREPFDGPAQIYTHVMQKPGLGIRSPLDG